MEQQGWFLGLDQFKENILIRFGSEISDVSLIKDLGGLLEVKNGEVGLVPLQRAGSRLKMCLEDRTFS